MPTIFSIWQRNLCAVTGAIAGGITGLVFGLFLVSMPHMVLTLKDILLMGSILAIVAWIAILVVIGLWLHYGVPAIAWQSLVTSWITAILTVYVCDKVHLALLAVWIGLLIGTLIGALLCRLCKSRLGTTGGTSYAMR